jgi:hypothetical protein
MGNYLVIKARPTSLKTAEGTQHPPTEQQADIIEWTTA